MYEADVYLKGNNIPATSIRQNTVEATKSQVAKFLKSI